MNSSGVAVTGIFLAWIAGCPKQKTPPAMAYPPAPVAAAKVEPPPAAEPARPLSTPQTQVTLPPAQPLTPEALASIPPPPPAPEPPAAKPVEEAARPAPRPIGPRLPMGPQPGAEAAPQSEERPRIQVLLPPEERRRQTTRIQARLRGVTTQIAAMSKQRLTPERQSLLERVQAFVDQANGALKRGDVRQADALSERAQVLASELQNAP